MTVDTAHITRLLRGWADGDSRARDELIPIVYSTLHRLAERYLRREHNANTLQPTVLVHEAYLRLVDNTSPRWDGRDHSPIRRVFARSGPVRAAHGPSGASAERRFTRRNSEGGLRRRDGAAERSRSGVPAGWDGNGIPPDALTGDLDRIVLMALEHDPGRRYASAEALADDLRRSIERKAIAAPPLVTARARTFGRRHRVGLLASLAGLAILLVAGGYFVLRSNTAPTRALPDKLLLAALPLQNLTGDAEQEYFVEGLHEEIISRLGQLRPDRLGVIARTSMLQYRGTNKSIAAIGAELGAQYVLEGSVRRAGERVRVTAQLIQVSDQSHVWTQSFERDLRDLFPCSAKSVLMSPTRWSSRFFRRRSPPPSAARS